MLTKALALELAPYNILVNAAAPGGIMTPGTKRAFISSADLARARGVSVEELEAQRETTRARLPLHRMGEPDDIAKVVLFLSGAAADYMTGSVVLVDGGLLLTGGQEIWSQEASFVQSPGQDGELGTH